MGDVRGEERAAPAIGPHRSVSQFDLACVLGREYRGRDKRTINGVWGKNQLFVWEFAGGRNRAVSVENSGGKLAASREIFEALINLALVVAILPADAHHGHDLEVLEDLVHHSIVSVMEASEGFQGRA